jgi:hypothetical protein
LTQREHSTFEAIQGRLVALREALVSRPVPEIAAPVEDWLAYLAMLKGITGNASNDVSFVACLLAKRYLCERLPMHPFDAAAKPQGAPGLDIDERTTDGRRVVAEIKTTTPYLREKGLGANQKTTFVKDFDKLAKAQADVKFFFVTDRLTYEAVRQRYASHVHGVTVVLLGTGESWQAPT